jgi:hypothetical protein
MGMYIDSDHGLPREHHGEVGTGYRAALTRYPSERLGVAVLCNLGSVNAETLAEKVAEVLLPHGADAGPSSASQAIDARVFAPYAGTYVLPDTFEDRTLEIKDGKLLLRIAVFSIELELIDAHTAKVKGSDTRYVIEPAAGETGARLIRTAPGEERQAFERIAPFELDVKALKDYVGRYASDEATRDLELVESDHKLFIRSWGRALYPEPFAPIAHDVFRHEFVGLGGAVRFLRDAGGRVTGLVISTPRLRQMKWQRRATASDTTRK